MAGTCSATPHSVRKDNQQKLKMAAAIRNLLLSIIFVCSLCAVSQAQGLTSEYTLSTGGTLEIINNFGRVEVQAVPAADDAPTDEKNVKITAASEGKVYENEVSINASGSSIVIEVKPSDTSKRGPSASSTFRSKSTQNDTRCGHGVADDRPRRSNTAR